MFENVGKNLKQKAEKHVWSVVLVYGFVGAIIGIALAMCFNIDIVGFALFSGMLVGDVIGYFVGRRKAMEYYGFAEIVDCAVQLRQLMDQKTTSVAPSEPICPNCGARCPDDARWCAKCGTRLAGGEEPMSEEDRKAAIFKRWLESELLSDESHRKGEKE